MASSKEIILEYVCPSLGVCTANLMWLAPVKDLKSALAAGMGLGDLNPTPWAFMLGNCLGWTAYGILGGDWFLFCANYFGFFIACWLNLGAVKLMYSSHHKDETRRSLVQYLSASVAQMDPSTGSDSPPREDDGDGAHRQLLLKGVDSDDEEGNGAGNSEGNDEPSSDDRKTTATDTPPSTAPTHDRINSDSKPNTQHQDQLQHRDWTKIARDVTSQVTPAKSPHERLVLGMAILWSVVLSAIGFYSVYVNDNGNSVADADGNSASDNSLEQKVLGYVVNLNLIFFYGAPLSAIRTVLTTKQSNAFHVPTMVTNTSNSVFWTSYAVAINDPIVYVPNGLGVLLGAIQFFLLMVFPKTPVIIDGCNGSRDANKESMIHNCDLDGNNNIHNEKVPDPEEPIPTPQKRKKSRTSVLF